MANNKTLELSIKIAGKMDKSLMAALNGSQSQISSFARSISSIGTAGLAAMGTLATATVATIASCTKEAAKFENYMADVVKYVDGLADATGKISDKVADNGKTYAQNYEAMKDAIKDLSTQIPYTQEDLTRLAAAAGQSGKAMEDLIKVDASGNVTGFLRDIAMTGAAMDISADQAGNWAAKWEQSLKTTKLYNNRMKVEQNKMVGVDYKLTVDGQIADQSRPGQPLEFIFGTGMLLPKFEEAILGKEIGESVSFTLEAKDGYGEVIADAIVDLPKDIFMVDGKLAEDILFEGSQVPMSDAQGNRMMGIVKEVGESTVKMDFNHPMAGKTLNFDVEVVSVRDVTPEDLQGGCSCGECGGDCGEGCGDHDGHCNCH